MPSSEGQTTTKLLVSGLISVLAVAAALLCVVILLPCDCIADEHDSGGDGRPIVAVWKPRVQWGELESAKLRFAVWTDGQVAYSWPAGSFSSTRLRWGRLPPDALEKLKDEVTATGVFSLSRTQYLLFDAADIRMILRIGQQEMELRWDEGGSAPTAFAANPQDYWRFIDVWKMINAAITSHLPTNAVVLEREWRWRGGAAARAGERKGGNSGTPGVIHEK